jgi:hypothetical protein
MRILALPGDGIPLRAEGGVNPSAELITNAVDTVLDRKGASSR